MAIHAAATPEKTPYLYFVADASGRHTFSKTFEEHVQAIAEIRRARAASETNGGQKAPFAPASPLQ